MTEHSRLMRIAISNETAKRMDDNGWTVEKVAKAEIKDLRKYSFSDEISTLWIKNAVRYLGEQ